MKHKYPIKLTEELNAILEIKIRINMENVKRSEQLGMDPDVLTMLMIDKLNEVSELIAEKVEDDFLIEE